MPPLRFTEMAVARERHRVRNVTDFLRRLTSCHSVVYHSVKLEQCTRREAGFLLVTSRKQTNRVMNARRLLSQFRISDAMRPYVLRLRLRGTDFEFGSEPEQAFAYTKCVSEMRRILVEKRRVAVIAADRAIIKSLEAAFDFQLAHLRYRFLRTMEGQSHTTLDHLIRGLRQLSNAIAPLPPNSKGELNKRVVGIVGQAQFDSETFIGIIETITATLPQIGPRRLADDILSLIHPEPGGTRRPPIIDQWEAMPATTRMNVEAILGAKPARSLMGWLNNVADLLEEEQSARKQGAPRSISRVFVSRIATIWRTLGLNPGLAYDFFLHPADDDRIGRGGRVESTFQRYCRAALTAVGDSTEISARQVINYKRNASSIRIR
jgi:hypothetical protein